MPPEKNAQPRELFQQPGPVQQRYGTAAARAGNSICAYLLREQLNAFVKEKVVPPRLLCAASVGSYAPYGGSNTGYLNCVLRSTAKKLRLLPKPADCPASQVCKGGGKDTCRTASAVAQERGSGLPFWKIAGCYLLGGPLFAMQVDSAVNSSADKRATIDVSRAKLLFISACMLVASASCALASASASIGDAVSAAI